MKKIIILSLLLTTLLSGCATIVGDKSQLVPITSTPSDASIVITDERGVEVFKGTTPTNVMLNKSDGSYWGKKNFVVEITKEGYAKQVIPVKARANGWYIGGNIIFGGLIGWFIVDPLNGGMYTLSVDQIESTLGTKAAHNNSASNKSISIVLLEDVPVSLRLQMNKIN